VFRCPGNRQPFNPPLSVEFQEGGKVRDYSVGDIPEIWPKLGLMLGDCLHNFRATLDNLAFTIATENNPAGLTSKERKAVTFPIADQRSDFLDACGKGAIAKMPPRARAGIQRLQPYHYGEDAKRHPLSVLRQLTDMDKHRFIPMVAWNVEPFVLTPSIPGARLTPLAQELIPHTKLLRVTVPTQYANVDVQVRCQFSVVLQEPETLRNWELENWLDEIWTYLERRVIPSLAVHCPAASPEMIARARHLKWRSATLPGRHDDAPRQALIFGVAVGVAPHAGRPRTRQRLWDQTLLTTPIRGSTPGSVRSTTTGTSAPTEARSSRSTARTARVVAPTAAKSARNSASTEPAP